MPKIIFPEEKPMFKWSLKWRISENLSWIQEVNRKVSWLRSEVNDLKDENQHLYKDLSGKIAELENQHQYKNLLDEIAELKFLLACMYASVVGLLVLTAILLLTR